MPNYCAVLFELSRKLHIQQVLELLWQPAGQD